TRKDLVAANIDSLYALFPSVNSENEFVLNTDPMAKSKVVYKTHVVRRGESLGRISSKYNVSVADIKKWNNMRRSTIVAGQRIKIKKEIPAVQSSPVIARNKKPASTEEPKVEAIAANTKEEVKSENKSENKSETKEASTKVVYEYQVKNITKTHKVKRGENLGLIANKYEVDVADIKKWNKMKSSKLMAGQALKIKTTESVRIAKKVPAKISKPEESTDEAIASAKIEKVPERNEDENKFVFYKVEIGDTLWAIAKKYAGNTVENIKSLNGLKDNESLKAGMILKIPKKG
ncbi:MAG: LysM peptidoglycan-binding domain-containing protein, partial [bacterium]